VLSEKILLGFEVGTTLEALIRGIVKAIPSDLEYFAKYRPSEFESRKKEAVRDLREYAEIKKNLKNLKDELRMLREKLSLKLKREIK
jgi:hypothetical protein